VRDLGPAALRRVLDNLLGSVAGRNEWMAWAARTYTRCLAGAQAKVRCDANPLSYLPDEHGVLRQQRPRFADGQRRAPVRHHQGEE
jgi:hypothetical protein